MLKNGCGMRKKEKKTTLGYTTPPCHVLCNFPQEIKPNDMMHPILTANIFLGQFSLDTLQACEMMFIHLSTCKKMYQQSQEEL